MTSFVFLKPYDNTKKTLNPGSKTAYHLASDQYTVDPHKWGETTDDVFNCIYKTLLSSINTLKFPILDNWVTSYCFSGIWKPNKCSLYYQTNHAPHAKQNNLVIYGMIEKWIIDYHRNLADNLVVIGNDDIYNNKSWIKFSAVVYYMTKTHAMLSGGIIVKLGKGAHYNNLPKYSSITKANVVNDIDNLNSINYIDEKNSDATTINYVDDSDNSDMDIYYDSDGNDDEFDIYYDDDEDNKKQYDSDREDEIWYSV